MKKVNEQLNERAKIYLKAPSFWKEKLQKRFKGSKVPEAVRLYVGSKRTLDDVGNALGVTRERVRQLVAEGLFYIFRIYQFKKVKDELSLYFSKIRKKLTIDEFNQIKQLLFEGNSQGEIEIITKRPQSTISRIKLAETYEDYFTKFSLKMKERERKKTLAQELAKKELLEEKLALVNERITQLSAI